MLLALATRTQTCPFDTAVGCSNHVLCVCVYDCVCAVVVSNHEPSGDWQHRAGGQGGFMDRDPATGSDLDGSDERPHQQPHFSWLRPGCQR